jgi:hypothetical protein
MSSGNSVLKDGKLIDEKKLQSNINIEEEAFRILKDIEDKKLDNNNVISELYIYDDINMYTFYRPGAFARLKKIVAIIDFMTCINKVVEDEEKKFYTDDIFIKKLVEVLLGITCVMKNVQVETEPRSKSIKNLLTRGAKGLSTYKRYKKNKDNKESFLIISHATSITEGKSGYYDYEYGKVLEDIIKDYNCINLQYLNSPDAFQNSIEINTKLLPFELFVIYKKIKWKRLFDNSKITNKLESIDNANYLYKGYNIISLVLGNSNDFKVACDSYIKEFLVAKEFMMSLKVKNIITVDEGDRARCFILAGNKIGINTYAIQHGLISNTSPTYMIRDENQLLIPKKTFVWGSFYKNLLVEGAEIYNDKNVVVTGQPRTDMISNEPIKNSGNKIKILYATQYLEDLTKSATEILFNALSKSDKEYELIIKLHPIDNFLQFYDEMIEKYKLENIKVTKKMELYDALSWCDLVISVHSTVVLEGALHKKPSVCILLDKYYDEGHFVRDGISLGASTSNELMEIINNKSYEKVNSMDKYIEENFYKIDGNAHLRVMDAIAN